MQESTNVDYSKNYMKIIKIVILSMLMASCVNRVPQNEKADAFQEIDPREIDINPVKLFADDWCALAAGNSQEMNLMTIAWGGIGQLWSKPVATVYVSSSRYTYQFMEDNEYFTITHFPEEMRSELQYLGTVSGRDEDKVKGAGLTPLFTESGSPYFAEADLVIECKKIYSEQFQPDLLPVDQLKWYQESGTGIHVAYYGEILHVWRK